MSTTIDPDAILEACRASDIEACKPLEDSPQDESDRRWADGLKRLLEAGASLEAADNSRWTALFYAVRNHNVDCIKALCALGADVDAQALNGWTPLMLAANMKDADAVCALLALGAKVDARGHKGETALMLAAMQKVPEAIAALCKAGATVNARDAAGRTPLMLALRGEEALDANQKARALASVTALIAFGADCNAQDDLGRLAISYAASEASKALLLKAGAENICQKPMMHAGRYRIKAGQTPKQRGEIAWAVCFDTVSGLYTAKLIARGPASYGLSLHPISVELYDGVDALEAPYALIRQGKKVYSYASERPGCGSFLDARFWIKEDFDLEAFAWTPLPTKQRALFEDQENLRDF